MSTESPVRVTKRKLDDAIQILDDAVARTEPDRPLKRPNMAPRSLYSTLLKYGIKDRPKESVRSRSSSLDKLPQNTPNLSAILSRAAAKTRKVLHTPMSLPSSGTADYRPSSLPSFLNRLSTFKLSTFANKPTPIDAVAASRCGWSNSGKDRLVCDLCTASWVMGGREGLSQEAANTLVEKQRVSLVENHKSGCPWKTRQCDDSIYRIPLQSPTAMAKEIRKTATQLTPLTRTVQIKHTLTLEQIASLMAIIDSVCPANEETTQESSFQPGSISAPPSPTSSTLVESGPSDTAVIIALYGWSLSPATAPAPIKPRSSFSLSRASSVLSRSQSPLPSPTPARASSVSMREDSPAPRLSISRPRPLSSISTIERSKREAGLLQCKLCQRRLGLWSFATHSPDVEMGDLSVSVRGTISTSNSKELDLLREHRSYCPYVAVSSVVPTLPSSKANKPSEPIAGWKAVLTVVMRHGMGQRQSLKLPKQFASEQEAADAYGVDAMVDGVKARGGKELLKYVRELLG